MEAPMEALFTMSAIENFPGGLTLVGSQPPPVKRAPTYIPPDEGSPPVIRKSKRGRLLYTPMPWPAGTTQAAWDAIRKLIYLGTEYEAQQEIAKTSWSWYTLAKDLSPGGRLYEMLRGFNDEEILPTMGYVYLYASTEVQHVRTKKNPTGKIVHIPIVLALFSKIPIHGCRLGVKGLQMEEGQIVQCNRMRVEWIPSALEMRKVPVPEPLPGKPPSRRHLGPTTDYSRIVQVLTGGGRASACVNLSMTRKKTYEFATPYFAIPRIIREEMSVPLFPMFSFSVINPGTREVVPGTYNPEMDDLNTFAEEFLREDMRISSEAVGNVAWESMLKSIKDEAMRGQDQAIAAHKKRMEGLEAELKAYTDEEAAAMDAIEVYKYYPWHAAFHVNEFSAIYASRYLGNATMVICGEASEADIIQHRELPDSL